MKSFLQGKWLRHPLHPLLVHFPIGLFVLSLVLDAASLVAGGNNPLVRGAFNAMLGGLAMMLVAAIPGLADWADIRADHPAKRPATLHMGLNIVAVALYAVNLGYRVGNLDEAETPILGLVLSLVGIGVQSVSGYLGGKIIYDEGIAVGRHRRDTDTPGETLRVSSQGGGAEGGYVRVAAAKSLGDGETLRAEVDGNVMAIARVGGELFAFQEFCTHRFGPLSDGAIYRGQVECPWHRSCFDMRTGKVTQGPAKLDLKTFDVREKEGEIQVRVPEKAYPGEQKAMKEAAAKG